jgi:hypothetical protein
MKMIRLSIPLRSHPKEQKEQKEQKRIKTEGSKDSKERSNRRSFEQKETKITKGDLGFFYIVALLTSIGSRARGAFEPRSVLQAHSRQNKRI